MAPNAIIRIEQGITLIIDNGTYITSCGGGNGDMWQGIHLSENGSSSMPTLEIYNSSTIEDAITAVYTEPVDDEGRLIIDGAVFNRNRNHIRIDHDDGSSQNYGLQGSIVGTQFICDANLHDPFAGLTTDTVVVFLFVQEPSGPDYAYQIGPDNYFDNALGGLHLNHSTTFVQNNTFDNIHFGIDVFFDGGIEATGNTFYDPSTAIEASDHVNKVHIIENNVYGNGQTTRGIIVRYSCQDIKVNGNYLSECSSYGIRVSYNQRDDYFIEVNDNILENTVDGSTTGIIAMESTNYTPIDPDIEINRNQVRGFNSGIRAFSLTGPQIIDNEIELSAYYFPTGINVIVGRNATVKGNSVTGATLTACDISTDPPDISTGIRINNSTDTYVACNTVGQLQRGFEYRGFTGNITSTHFYQNYMGYCSYQFYLNNVPNGLGNIGGSNSCMDDWSLLGTCASSAGTFKNTMSYNSNNGSGGTTFSVLSAPSYNGSANGGVACGFSVVGSVPVDGYCGDGGGDENLMAMIDTMNNRAEYDENIFYWENEYLLARAKSDSALADSLPALADVADSLLQTNIGAFAEVKNSIQAIETGNATTAIVSTVQSINNTVQPELTIESNNKAVNNIYLYCLTHDIHTLNTTQVNTLVNIAAQCPLSGGRAVFTARFLLELLNDTVIDYNDDCIGYQAARKFKHLEEDDINAYVFAADAKIYIRFDQPLQTPVLFYHYNSLGITVTTAKIPKGTGDTDISCTSAVGMYYFNIISTSLNKTWHGKLQLFK